MIDKKDHYLVTLSIIEGRYFAWINMDSFVVVKVGKRRKYTTVKKGSDSPYFNQYFVFELRTTLKKLLDVQIRLTVIRPCSLRHKRKPLGYVQLDVATVWSQSDHQFYHKWAVLSNAKNEVTGPRGYLKVDINVLAPGQSPIAPVIDEAATDEIEGNLLLPLGTTSDRQSATYVFDVYSGDHLTKHGGRKEAHNVHVQINFVGLKVKSSTRHKTQSPVWNEQLRIRELFPPLCQRIKVQIKFGNCCDNIVAPADNTLTHYLHIRSISNDGENGFLPTFGPAFVHFYHDTDRRQGYAGKLLMAVRTEIHEKDSIMSKFVATKPIEPIKTSWKDEEVVLHCSIFEATFIEKTHAQKSLSFDLSLGPWTAEDRASEAHHQKPARSTETDRHGHYYLKLFDRKPCLQLQCPLPDFRARSYNYNMLDKITHELKLKLDDIEHEFRMEEYAAPGDRLQRMLPEAFDFLATSCRKYLDMVAAMDGGGTFSTELDTKWRQFCLEEMKDVEKRCNTLYNPFARRKSFRKLSKMYMRLMNLQVNPQECWPDIFISMMSGQKQVGFYRLKARDAMFSLIEEEKGRICGKVQCILMEAVKQSKLRYVFTSVDDMMCKLDAFLWIGLQKHYPHCVESIPSGFTVVRNASNGIPLHLTAQERHVFQCRAHIYQGRFVPGADTSGLSDSFVKVIIGPYEEQTMVKYASINPIWDQTLLLKPLEVYGSKDFIKECPPMVLIQCLDKDKCCKQDIMGRNNTQPLVKLADEPYDKPRFPPKLYWLKIYNRSDLVGEVLLAIELLELTEPPPTLRPTSTVMPIPDDIKPAVCRFKIEVVFWGVRKLKRIDCCTTLHKPRITLESYGVVLHSDTLVNVHKNLNFSNPIKSMEVKIPCYDLYAPSLPIKLFESKGFGRYVYEGIHLINVQNFLYFPLTSAQRERLLVEGSGSSSMQIASVIELPTTKPVLIKPGSKPLAAANDAKKAEPETDINVFTLLFKCCKCFCKCVWKLVRFCWRLNCTKKALARLLAFFGCGCCPCCRRSKEKKKSKRPGIDDSPSVISVENDSNEIVLCELDWWMKYYASTNTEHVDPAILALKLFRVKIYGNELESQPEFEGFRDTLMTFPLFKGKRTGDDLIDSHHVTGVFKGAIKIYRWPPVEKSVAFEKDMDVTQVPKLPFVTRTGFPLKDGGVFQDFPYNEVFPFTVRVYVVKGINLRPKDLNGKSDPYLKLRMGDVRVNDVKNALFNQVNPVFGRCIEMTGKFPMHHEVVVEVWDRDVGTADDLIGKTTVDVENRFYTEHRARCGLALMYQKDGLCAWRDKERPSKILQDLCRSNNIPPPDYTETGVFVCNMPFQSQQTIPLNRPKSNVDHNSPPPYTAATATAAGGEEEGEDEELDPSLKEKALKKEQDSLAVLHRWHEIPLIGCHLVPEHVETRSLYHPDRPGLEQGKLQMWIDIFPIGSVPLPKPVDISPRKPVPYELRVIIWNTEEVILQEDEFFLGEKKSDIYVKSWLGISDTSQSTDVHYRSLNGEGNFNWRFVFRFDYLAVENRIVFKKKESAFDKEHTELKLPCKLTVQIWDNDTVTPDDFLGTMTMDLTKFHRGAKNVRQCDMKILQPDAPSLNLFKNRRTKGWWPCVGREDKSQEEFIGGKLEAEFELMTVEDADKDPVGIGREPPHPLPLPNRPDTSFSWFRSPFKALKYLLCKVFSCKNVVKVLVILLIGAFVALGIYSVPGYTVKKILRA